MHKAYDRIYRPLASKQLQKLGIGGNMAHFIRNSLEKRTFQTKIGNVFSNTHVLENGVPQGSVSSVFCFLLTINDFEKELNDSFRRRYPDLLLVTLSYADDKASIIQGAQNSKFVGEATQYVLDFTDKWMISRKNSSSSLL